MRLVRTCAALVLAASGIASALPAGAVEVKTWTFSLLGGFGMFDERLHYPADSLADAPLGGARLAYRLGNHFSLEASGSYGQTHELRPSGSNGDDVTVMTAGGALIAHLSPEAKWGDVYLGAGGGYNRYKAKSATDDAHFGTFDVLAGWSIPMGDAARIRLEARNLLNVPKDDWQKSNLADQQYWGGISFGFGGAPKDTDADGVPDKKDKCPDTPSGATVDATGCPTDSDGDGVWDGIDQCIGTPQGARVDAKGCPTDADGDGVYDGVDACDATPRGATVDAKGCPTDSDGDGVFDGLDQCAATPRGATVDARGCPSDSDGDGVFDGIDRCPGTAAGLKVDSEGCPIEVTEKETELLDTGMIRLQNVNFETGRATLLPESFAALDEVGTILLKWPQLNMEIGGHTDSRGTEALNQRLSEARAQSVKDYLTQKFPGLAQTQLEVRGYGESRPLVRNTTQLNMAKNRRVEFKVTNRDVLKKEIERRKLLQK
jgi:OOP family OmpA-OmpF porin